MTIQAEINRDAEGFPSNVILTDGAKKISVDFDRDVGFKISGSRRSLTPDMIELLRLIYPAQQKFDFKIPEPLQVNPVQGGKTILFDDMEDLLKWTEVQATVALDNTNAYSKDQALLLTAAAGGVARARRYFGLPLSAKVSLELVFSVDNYAKMDNLLFILSTQGANFLHYGSIGYFPNTTGWNYLLNGGAYYQIAVLNPPSVYETHDGVGGAWTRIKFALDFKTVMYKFLEVENRRANIPTVGIDEGGPGAFDTCSFVDIVADAAAGQDLNVWVDDVLVKEEE